MSSTDFKQNYNGLLDAVVRSLADPIFVIDEAGCYVDVLGGIARQYYDSGEYLIGRKMQEVMPQETAEQFLAVLKRALDENRVQTLEYKLSSVMFDGNQHDGPDEEQWFEARVSPIPAGVVTHHRASAWVVINITHRKFLEAQLKRLAITDELTGCLNRRAFIETTDKAITQAKRYGHVLQVALMDLDYFKRINDTLGHPVGDQVLRHVSTLLRSRVRKTDILGRIGGEEFALCMPETSPDEAQVVLDDIRDILRHKLLRVDLGNDHSQRLAVTFSMGLTSLLPTDRNVIDLFIRADKNLYRAKHEGRDCIMHDPDSS